MSVRDALIAEIGEAPEEVLSEVLDFVRYLKTKESLVDNPTARANEAVLAKDWLRPEEDEAWRDL